MTDQPMPSPAEAQERLEQALFEIRRVIAGQDAMLERVLVCLRPEDVALARADTLPSSVRNHVAGRITAIVPLGFLARVVVDCGVPIVAVVTRRSLGELGLAEGEGVIASFKATAAHLLRRG